MSAISQIGKRLLGGGGRAGGARPTTGTTPRGSTGAGSAGGSSTDAAIGKGVRTLLGRFRR